MRKSAIRKSAIRKSVKSAMRKSAIRKSVKSVTRKPAIRKLAIRKSMTRKPVITKSVTRKAAIRAELFEAWLALTSVKCHDNLLILMLLNQWLALTMLRTTGPSTKLAISKSATRKAVIRKYKASDKKANRLLYDF